MRVKLLFFGATADSAGEREVEIELPDGANSAVALDRILERFPTLAESHKRESLHFSINQEYANGDQSINDGDELAVFTAVSGG